MAHMRPVLDRLPELSQKMSIKMKNAGKLIRESELDSDVYRITDKIFAGLERSFANKKEANEFERSLIEILISKQQADRQPQHLAVGLRCLANGAIGSDVGEEDPQVRTDLLNAYVIELENLNELENRPKNEGLDCRFFRSARTPERKT